MFGTPKVIRPSASVSIGVVGPRGASLIGFPRPPLITDGNEGDYFIDLTAGDVRLYGPKTSGIWPSSYLSLVGPQGSPGPQILSGPGAPTQAIGTSGDYYLDTAASIFYGPKTTGQWPTPGVSLVGNTGQPGPANTLTIGTVTALAPGATPTVTIAGTAPNQSIAFGLPQGPPGRDGTGAGTVVGPATSTAGHLASYADGTGTNLSDSGIDPTTLATKAFVTSAVGSAATDTLYNSQDIRALYLILSGQTGTDRLNGIATIADGFNDQSDVATTTGATYDGTNHRYSVTNPGYTSKQTAAQAIGTAPYSASYPLSNAFDANTTTYFAASNAGLRYAGQDFGSTPQSIRQVVLTNSTAGSQAATSVAVEYSDDNSAWTVATTASVNASANAITTISVPESGAHRYWRLSNSPSTASPTSYWYIAELTFNTYVAGTGMVLQSAAFPSDIASPTKGRMLVQVDGTSATFTPNTDLVASVSRDGGTTFTAGTLAYVETLADGTKTYETGLIDMTSTPAGSSIVWKIATANSKSIIVSGVVLQWRP